MRDVHAISNLVTVFCFCILPIALTVWSRWNPSWRALHEDLQALMGDTARFIAWILVQLHSISSFASVSSENCSLLFLILLPISISYPLLIVKLFICYREKYLNKPPSCYLLQEKKCHSKDNIISTTKCKFLCKSFQPFHSPMLTNEPLTCSRN